MPRLLFNVNIPRFFYTHRLPLAYAAQEAGYDVHVTTSDHDKEYVQKIIATGLPYHPLPLAQHGTNPLSEANALRATIALYRELKPDLIHHVSIKPVLYGGVAAQLTGIHNIVGAMSGLGRLFVAQDTKMRVLRQIAKPMLKLVLSPNGTRMIFQNPDDLDLFVQQGFIARDKTVLIKGSGVDINVFAPKPEPDGKPVILFAGRLMWQKGLGDFVEAAKILHDKATFVVAGFAEATSPDTVSPDQLREWEQQGYITWLGKRDDMPEVFAQSHIVCLPSTYGEGVPKVLIEAASCQRPIVTTDTPGCREITHHEKNGLLVPPSDISALVDALERLIINPDERQRMGDYGRDLVAREFSLEYVLNATLALYEQLLQSE